MVQTQFLPLLHSLCRHASVLIGLRPVVLLQRTFVMRITFPDLALLGDLQLDGTVTLQLIFHVRFTGSLSGSLLQ